MSILATTKTISIIYFILPVNHSDNTVSIAFIFTIDIFYLTGELISLHSLHCSPLAVDHYRPDLTNHTSWATASTFVNGWGGLASTRE